jgi:hypothetical protein
MHDGNFNLEKIWVVTRRIKAVKATSYTRGNAL